VNSPRGFSQELRYPQLDTSGEPEDRLRLNNQDNTFADDDAETSGQGRGAGAGDFDNDNDVDLIVGTAEDIYRNDGTSTWTNGAPQPPANNQEALMFADIDGDADLDIWNPGASILWAENTGAGWTGRAGLPDGSGGFTIGSVINGEGASAADINNDGYLDFMFADEDDETSPSWTIYLGEAGSSTKFGYEEDNNPNGGTNVTGLPLDVTGHENMEWAWGDFDNDGDLDIYLSGVTNEGLYENDGSGGFTDISASAGITIVDPDGATWGDYNNDGFLDLLVAQAGGVSHLYRNEGDDTFTRQEAPAGFGESGDLGKTIGFFDSDNDGDLDFLVNNPSQLWRNNLNNNNYLKVLAFGNGTANMGSPKTPIGAQINVTDISGTLLAHRQIIPSQNQLAPPHMQHFGGLDPDTEYNIIVRFPSGTVTTFSKCTPGSLLSDIRTVYGAYTVPQTLNATETSGDKTIACSPIQVDVNDDTAKLDDEIISVIVKKGDFIQPDAGAPGMKLAVQFIGGTYSATDVITTDSSDIVVGPVIVTNTAGNNVTSGGSVLTTIFFINSTANAQSVEVFINGDLLERTFEIVIPTPGSGDFTGESTAWTHSLGNGDGKNGTRTVGGTIVLDSLIIPALVTVNVTAFDIDPSRPGNQGYLPAIILVDGPINITGTLDVSGVGGSDAAGDDGGDGGHGGPGGGGGGGGAGEELGSGGDGGDGFTGGGAGACENDEGPPAPIGGTGGDGSGTVGGAPFGTGTCDAGIGGIPLVGNATGGEGGFGDSSGAAGGGGGTGFMFGSGGDGGTDGAGGNSGFGGAGGGESDYGGEALEPGGGGFGTAGQDGGFPTSEGAGGFANANDQLVPIAGGSGGGGGGLDSSGATDDGAGGAGGGGGAVLIFAHGTFEVNGLIDASGGAGGLTGGDNDDAEEGGGGSGGAIILQALEVDASTSPGTIDASGGAGGNEALEPAGDGGDGRLRIDGLPQGISDFTGITVPSGSQGPPTEYVGPAIILPNQSHIVGTAAANANVTAKIWNGAAFNTFGIQADANGDFEIPVTYSPGTNYITVIQNTTNSIVVMS